MTWFLTKFGLLCVLALKCLLLFNFFAFCDNILSEVIEGFVIFIDFLNNDEMYQF